MNENTVKEGKTLAIVSYLTLLGTLIAFFMNQDKKNPFTYFHIRQGLGLGLTYIILGLPISILDNLNISMAFWVFFFVLYLYGIFGAVSGKMNKIPFLGDFYQKSFKNIGE